MRLSKALAVNRGDVVSLVGAGGKTTAMFRLAGELTSQGWRVITTTTTMIWKHQASEHTILEPDRAILLEKAQLGLDKYNHVTLVSGLREAEGKLVGVESSQVNELAALPGVDAIIVEADGAKGLSLKAPAPHEPVIPSSTTILVPVAAVDAMGQPLDGQTVHRPELVAGLAHRPQGETITAEIICRVVVHRQGGMKDAPEQARFIPLINKVTAASLTSARGIARLLLEEARVDRVLLGSVADEAPIEETWVRVAAMVLAAGESRRFGSPKQLLPWGETTLLEHVVNVALKSTVEKTIVVLGHRAEQFSGLLQGRPLQVVINEEWRGGLSTSVKAGLRALPANCDACLFLLADQPNVTSQLVDSVLRRYRRTLAPIVAPVHRGRRGNPVLFSRRLFPELLETEGDQGGRELILRHRDQMELVEVGEEDIFLDIDTIDDYRR